MNKVDELKNVISYHKQNGDEATLNYYNQQANLARQQANQALNAKYGNSTEYANNQANYQAQMGNYQAANTAVEQLKQAINQYKQNQVQLNNANEIAQKYTGTQLKAQGMSSVGESTNVYNSVNNQYLNNTAVNNQQYTGNVKSIADKYSNSVEKNNLEAQKTIANNNYNLSQTQQYADEEIKNAFITEMYDTQDIDDLDYIWNERGYAGEDAEVEKEYNTIRNRLLSQNALASLQTATNSKQIDEIVATLGNMDGMLPSTKKALSEAVSYKKATLAGWDGSSEPIDINNADKYSFGTFKGTGENGKQDRWVEKVLTNIKDGEYVDFNYGHGDNSFYYFSNGKFYKVNDITLIKPNETIWENGGDGFVQVSSGFKNIKK